MNKMKEFNLNEALAGKPVVHESGMRVTKIAEFLDHIVVKCEGWSSPVIYSKSYAQKRFYMAEEEMYILVSKRELYNMMLGQTVIHDSNPLKKGDCLGDVRVFKLVEVF